MSTSATHADADTFRTLCLVTPSFSTVCPSNGEVVAYGAVAQGASPNKFNLTYLRRGLYGTTPALHTTGAFFSRLDLGSLSAISQSIVVYDLPTQYIGATLYLKFVSFNRFHKAIQDVASVVEYTYSPTGIGYGAGTGGIPAQPTGLVVTPGPGQTTIFWNANSITDNVKSYTVLRAAGPGGSLGGAIPIFTGLTLTFIDSGHTAVTTYTYFVVATNAVGNSVATTGVDATTEPMPPPPGATPVGDTNYAMASSDFYVYSSAAFTAPHTWQLPRANTFLPGQSLYVADPKGFVSSTNTLTITRKNSTSDTIEGGTSVILNGQYSYAIFQSDGTSAWSNVTQIPYTAPANQFVTGYLKSGGFTSSKPTFANIDSGTSAATWTGGTLSGGTLAGVTAFPNGQLGSDGSLLVGSATAATTYASGSSVSPFSQINSNGSAASFGMFRWSATAAATGRIFFGKSHGAAVGTFAATGTDIEGEFSFAGASDLGFCEGAKIQAAATGAPGSGALPQYTPTRINFGTSPGGSTAVTMRWSVTDTGHLLPYTTNTYNIGEASHDIANGWTQNAWTVVSDGRLKTNFRSFNDAESEAAEEILDQIGLFQWKDSVAQKGEGARLHSGLIAQDVERVMIKHGLDPRRYGWFCEDPLFETVTKLRPVEHQKTERKQISVRAPSWIEKDGKAALETDVPTIAADVPVWMNERDVPVFDSDGKPVMVEMGEGKKKRLVQRTIHFADPVMETVMESYDEEVPVLDKTGEQIMRLSIRYGDLQNWLLAAIWKRRQQLE